MSKFTVPGLLPKNNDRIACTIINNSFGRHCAVQFAKLVDVDFNGLRSLAGRKSSVRAVPGRPCVR